MREPNLDARPRSFAEASGWLSTLEQLTARCGLPNASQRLRALHRWASDLAGLDAEVVHDHAEDVERTARTEALGREVLADAATAVPHPNLNVDRVDAILAALAKGPLATREVARLVGGQRLVVKQALQRMAKAGTIEGVGHGPARRWWLPKATAEKKTLKDVVKSPSAPTVATVAGTGPTCTRCDCPFSDHDPETGKCYGKKGKCICGEFYR